ncbi:unnamed protein product [Caenorhabditis auriculariae]|uniref:G-protein coupled receptors family 1 profile domain-containing protein n=1 Tax=Caenorhabditis auriculariae TaxID=2777116 RepID=A0A8S1GUV2_9PELO|nr:unnamed protein product [Caenorhabditis auriculariae]
MTLKQWLGVGFGVVNGLGLVLNIVVLRPVYILGFVQKKSPIYIISLVNIMNDIIHLSLAFFYLVPCILTESWLFEEGQTSVYAELISSMFMFAWYTGCLTQILMAINRLVVICCRGNNFFSHKNTICLFVASTPLLLFATWLAQYGFSCCKFSFDHRYLSYSYVQIEGLPNYSNQFIDLWLNSTTTGIAVISYTIIFVSVRSTSKTVVLNMSAEQRRSRRVKEYSYAVQFFLISVFYTFSWVAFRVFPILIGESRVEWFVLISLCVSINSIANALIYVLTNKEVQNQILALGTKLSHINSTHNGNTSYANHPTAPSVSN